ncbi:KinB-signaling pathway activation protein [Alicyclobacillus curvatus]|jgi:KinB signaling pathway activation protein|nr:KinB-signaling pathway activation protein [Alicyclobacillus curvatus]
MRLNQFIFLIVSTVVLGAVAGIMTSVLGLWLHVPWFVGLVSGAFLATTSLMGFWAYLTLNFIAAMTLPRRVWRWTQGLILVLVLYDMLWWRYHIDTVRHPANHTALSAYLIQGLWPLAVAIVAAVVKRRLSGRGSFLPSVFYLYVFTIVDWLLVIRAESAGAIVNQTGLVMMVCNVYLLLIYGKLLSTEARQAVWAKQAEDRVQYRERVKLAKAQAKADKKQQRREKKAQAQVQGTENP